MRVVVESPLGAPTAEGRRENLRYALRCCRALELSGHDPICSHGVKPWSLDDTDPGERQRGIDSAWFWLGDTHVFFADLGLSAGMHAAYIRCRAKNIADEWKRLADYPECWAAFQRGEWPPHTEGFEVGR